jgi:hypothetical protein
VGGAGCQQAVARPWRCPWFLPAWLGATRVTVNDTAQQPGPGAGDDFAADGPDARLAAYVASTQTALDVLALATTLWLCVVPPGDFSTAHNVRRCAGGQRCGPASAVQ